MEGTTCVVMIGDCPGVAPSISSQPRPTPHNEENKEGRHDLFPRTPSGSLYFISRHRKHIAGGRGQHRGMYLSPSNSRQNFQYSKFHSSFFYKACSSLHSVAWVIYSIKLLYCRSATKTDLDLVQPTTSTSSNL